MKEQKTRLIDTRHPAFLSSFTDFEKFRLTHQGGDAFRERYLEKFDTREDTIDFQTRKRVTPIPAYAKSAINEIRNSIFQRLSDVVRQGGSESYQQSVAGEKGGIDRRGSTMNFFLGHRPLTDLLVMGQVGLYLDMPQTYGPTLADSQGKRPYLYHYAPEDILNWSHSNPEEPGEFSAILLRDTVMEYDQSSFMPTITTSRFRHMWVDPATGFVNVQFYDPAGEPIDQFGIPSGPIQLELTRIPFVLLDIGDSLLRDVADHQIALLNLGSSDVNYALRSNFPFFTQQRDERAVGGHLKRVASDGTSSAGGQGANDETVKVGVSHGRYYDMGAERPQFIAPPSEPLLASLKLQEKLEQDIRKLVHLAVVNLGTRASAESKAKDNEGLEAGLSYIGLVLEGAERKIANYWAAYEERVETRRRVAVVKYPDTYKLKSDEDRVDQSSKLSELMFAVPGRRVKKEIAKTITTVLLGGKVTVDTLKEIHDEIDSSPYLTSDPKTIIDAKEAGLVGEQTACMALGFEDDEYLKAREDHMARVKRIAEAQGQAEGNPGSRGVPDLDGEPGRAAREEKETSRNTDERESTRTPVRGEGKETQE